MREQGLRVGHAVAAGLVGGVDDPLQGLDQRVDWLADRRVGGVRHVAVGVAHDDDPEQGRVVDRQLGRGRQVDALVDRVPGQVPEERLVGPQLGELGLHGIQLGPAEPAGL